MTALPPEMKPCRDEKHVSVLLCQMRRNGLIQRVGIGRYRAVRS